MKRWAAVAALDAPGGNSRSSCATSTASKDFNDSLGHQAGDECLKQVAQTLAKSMDRGGDLVARYGGEEFSAILPDTSLVGAGRRRTHAPGDPRTADRHLTNPGGRVTASFGVASGVAMPEARSLSGW